MRWRRQSTASAIRSGASTPSGRKCSRSGVSSRPCGAHRRRARGSASSSPPRPGIRSGSGPRTPCRGVDPEALPKFDVQPGPRRSGYVAAQLAAGRRRRLRPSHLAPGALGPGAGDRRRLGPGLAHRGRRAPRGPALGGGAGDGPDGCPRRSRWPSSSSSRRSAPCSSPAAEPERRRPARRRAASRHCRRTGIVAAATASPLTPGAPSRTLRRSLQLASFPGGAACRPDGSS